MLPDHSIKVCVFLHWFTFKIDRRCVFSLPKINLLIFPESSPRKNFWQGKHRLISGRRFGNYQKQISMRLADKTRKELHKVFEQFDLKITAEANLHVVNFPDATFDLTTGKHKPCRKPNDDPLYIHKHSNYPPSILRQLPTSINKRISTLSSDKQVFDDAVQTYQNALRHI